MHRLGRGLVGLGLGDHPQRHHTRQDVGVAALQVARGVGDRIGAGGKLGRADQRGQFTQGQLIQLLAVIELCRRRDAVGAMAEEALVEVKLQDLVLAELALDLPRQQDLREFRVVVPFLAFLVEQLGHLHADGGAARHAPVVGGQGQPDGARQPLHVHAAVLVEAGVFRGDEGVLDLLGHLGDIDGIAPPLAEHRHQLAVPGIDVQGLLQRGVAQGVDAGELGRYGCVQYGTCHQPQQRQGQEDQDAPTKGAANT